jgi:hypothetical protein
LNEVALAVRDVSLTPSRIVIILKLTNVNSGVRVCDVFLDADVFAISDMHSIGVIGSGEGIYFLSDQLHTIRVMVVLIIHSLWAYLRPARRRLFLRG